MNILFFVSDGISEYNSSRWRASAFYNGINRNSTEHKVRIASSQDWLKQTELGKNLCNWADVISIQRVGIDRTIELSSTWRSRGKAVVIDYDDDYFRINQLNAAYKFWGEGNADITVSDGHKFVSKIDEHPISQFVKGLKAVTGATMPSRLLASDALEHTQSFFLPNYIEKHLYQTKNTREVGKGTVLGWGGSLSHIESFEHSGIIPALKTTLEKYKDVYLLIVGDKRVVKKLNEHGISDKVRFQQYVPYNQWSRTLLKYDIGLAPLAQEYDMRRSWIKVAEYMSMGIPFIATQGYPYEEGIIKTCPSGRFVNQGDIDKGDKANQAGWELGLSEMIENRKQMKEDAVLLSDRYFSFFDIDNNIDVIMSVFENIRRQQSE